MDSDFFVTRTITGHLRLSYGAFAVLQATSPFQYEPYVVPALEDGFQRESISFSVATDGLSADYTISDRQVYTSPPWPATGWSGSHTESTSNGVTYTSEVNVHLSGPPSAPMELLVARAIETAQLRLNIQAGDKKWGETFMLQGASLTTSIGRENSVDGRFRVQWVNSPTKGSALGNLALPRLTKSNLKYTQYKGQQDPYNQRVSPTPNVYGYEPHGDKRDTTALFLLTCCLQSPCADNSSRIPG